MVPGGRLESSEYQLLVFLLSVQDSNPKAEVFILSGIKDPSENLTKVMDSLRRHSFADNFKDCERPKAYL